MNPERWEQIKTIYHSALEREPGERDAFLDEACAGDSSLLEEVRSLLAQQSAGEDIFASPAMDAAARALAEGKAAEPRLNLVGRSCFTTASSRRSAKAAWEWSTAPGMNS